MAPLPNSGEDSVFYRLMDPLSRSHHWRIFTQHVNMATAVGRMSSAAAVSQRCLWPQHTPSGTPTHSTQRLQTITTMDCISRHKLPMWPAPQLNIQMIAAHRKSHFFSTSNTPARCLPSSTRSSRSRSYGQLGMLRSPVHLPQFITPGGH